jgi:hypothetical protein
MLPYDTDSSIIEADTANDLIHIKSAGTYLVTMGAVLKTSASKPAAVRVGMVERDSIYMDVSGSELSLSHTTPGENWPFQRFLTLSRSCRMTCTQAVRLKFAYDITMTSVGSEGCGMNGFSVIVDRVE